MTGFFAEGRYCEPTTKQSELIRVAIETLSGAGVDDPRGNARRLWAHVMPREPSEAEQGADAILLRYQDLIRRRANRVPMSHLLGYRDFYKHRFVVTEDVLDPRPDTEALVEQALSGPFARVLDLGTGSGCILLSLLAERPDVTGVGVDLSDAALEVARLNARTLNIADRVEFVVSDWFTKVAGAFDLIVSNPPYISQAEMAGLAPEVQNHEPTDALTDGADGLTCYRLIVAKAAEFLTPNGRLMVEIGPTQAAAVSLMMQDAGFAGVGIRSDLDGRDRVVFGHKPAETS